MLYLLLAIICSSMLSIIMRLSERQGESNISMLAINYVTCTILSLVFSGVGNVFPSEEGVGLTLGMGAFNGILYFGGFALMQLNTKKNGVVMSATFMKLGLLVPMVFSILVFGERMKMGQSIGVLLAIGSIILINMEKEETTVQFRMGLILLMLVGGMADGMSKVFEEIGNEALSSQFLLYTFAAACIVCWGTVIYKREKTRKRHLVYGVLIGVPNFFAATFLLRSLQNLPAVIAYPSFSVGTIIVVSMAGIGLFKERLGKRQWVAIGGILIALVLLNI